MEAYETPGGGRVGDLRPLSPDLNTECRAFAEALRSLFAGLRPAVSVRRYGARRHVSAGAVSRYLSGQRIPPWQFVQDLLTDVGTDRGSVATCETVEFLRSLHAAAQRTSVSVGHAVQQLQFQLAEADRLSRRSAAHSDVLGEALLDRNQRIADLALRLNQVESDWARERARADELVLFAGDREELLRERRRLESEVARLTAELEEARRRQVAAEARCELLERQLVVAEQQAGEEVPLSEPPRLARTGAVRARVLVVDDPPANLIALEAVLAAADCQVLAVSSGADALKALLQHDDVAVIILDVQMPGMDGYETAARIKRRARTRNIPIIFVTAIGADAENLLRGYDAGAIDFITKPFEPWMLCAKVSVLTEMHMNYRGTPRPTPATHPTDDTTSWLLPSISPQDPLRTAGQDDRVRG
ncbi:two-component system response regulator [Kitasatospora sp. NPDC059327]|uniref:response regulator n=1 Tax=Kitasatospora sp. NPDC059327 TaxID=3346803 RepID=UPI0036B5F3B4